ncbi:hypothetical protein [Kitasatospora camelliae]|uniref:Uncharacterized protein n=1 Tax=Kitasatospora camelliae TaxID=3156397 RepID=A0AAU8JSX9_9ACTN
MVTSYTDRVIPVPPGAWRTLVIVSGSTAPRVLLEVSGPPRHVRITTHDAGGNRGPTTTRHLVHGLHEIEVPPSGVCSLGVAPDPCTPGDEN